MDGCKSRICIINKNLQYKKIRGSHNNDFKRCNKSVYQEGFCKLCYEYDKRTVFPCINDRRWKRDGIYGEPYTFPFHKSEWEKLWVKMIYDLHPEINPENKFWNNFNKIKNRKDFIEILKQNLTDEEKIYLCEFI